MKVLFISRSKGEYVSVLIRNQGISLIKIGVEVDHFLITGKGLKGYLSGFFRLRKLISKTKYDAYHAHYSFCGFVATFAGCRPLVVSLMGSDVYYNKLMRLSALLFIRFFWKSVIVKSKHMAKNLNVKKIHVLPNGVDTKKYNLIDRQKAFQVSKLDPNYKNILFIADPTIPVKNYNVAKAAVDKVNVKYKAKLVAVTKVSNDQIPYFMNAGDILLLPSLWEGSPNVVKEALACNLPVVATSVGDIATLLEGVNGCFLCENSVEDIKTKLEIALERGTRINGRERIESLELSEDIVAKKLKNIYTCA